jgi:hypothetical protein
MSAEEPVSGWDDDNPPLDAEEDLAAMVLDEVTEFLVQVGLADQEDAAEMKPDLTRLARTIAPGHRGTSGYESLGSPSTRCCPRQVGNQVPHVSPIAAAAAPITKALAAIGELRINVPTADVLISYTHNGCVVRVADRRAEHRTQVEREFKAAFIAAGWSVIDRYAEGLGLQHPPVTART